MGFASIAKNIATFAPAIGAAVGGPIGSVVGLGAKAICSFFGIEPDAKDADAQVEAALNSMTAEQAVELKKLDKQFIKEMRALDVDVFKLEVEDRDSARKRERDMGSWDTRILGSVIVLGFFGTVFGVLDGHFQVVDNTMMGMLVGYVSAKAEQVVAYYFGSSMGSAKKTEQIGKAISKN